MPKHFLGKLHVPCLGIDDAGRRVPEAMEPGGPRWPMDVQPIQNRITLSKPTLRTLAILLGLIVAAVTLRATAADERQVKVRSKIHIRFLAESRLTPATASPNVTS